jgi:hypothetical protein
MLVHGRVQCVRIVGSGALLSCFLDGAMRPPVSFWEVGASGRRYSRALVLSTLAERWSSPHQDQWETSGFHCREVGTDTYALTYTLRQGERLTRRLTLWRKVAGSWKILFHQGTVVSEEPSSR